MFHVISPDRMLVEWLIGVCNDILFSDNVVLFSSEHFDKSGSLMRLTRLTKKMTTVIRKEKKLITHYVEGKGL